MDKNRIITAVKRQEEEKVAVSLKLPKSLKEQIQVLADSENISMNSLIVATLHSMIDDDCGKRLATSNTILSNMLPLLQKNITDIDNEGLDEDNIQEYLSYTSQIDQIRNAIKN